MALRNAGWFTAALSLVLLGAAAAVSVRLYREVARAKEPSEEESRPAEPEPAAIVDRSREHLEEAERLIQGGQLVSAKDRLDYLVEQFPESEVAPRARDLLSRLNIDLLFTRWMLGGKGTHVVRPKESIASIARKRKTTVRYLQQANGLRSLVIHPGEELLFQELDFEADLDTAARLLELTRDGKFFCHFPVESVVMPPGVMVPLETKVWRKGSSVGGKVVSDTDPAFSKGVPFIEFDRPDLRCLCSEEEAGAAGRDEPGVYMKRKHVEDLLTLLRVGTPVQIRS